MADQQEWSIAEDNQPRPENLDYDLRAALSSLFTLRSEVPEDAFTAHALGTERAGTAVLVNDKGLLLTIGYLVAEAESLWIVGQDGAAVEGHPLAYDFTTGFGLVQALGKLPYLPLPLGNSSAVHVGDRVVFASAGGIEHALAAQVVSKREFAGYWEYVLDEAFFTTPAHPFWGGGAMLNEKGELVGIGSLYVGDARGHGMPSEGNMIVPIDLAKPLLQEIADEGRVSIQSRPWLGFYTAEAENHLIVAGIAPKGPAERAGVATGDVVLEVAGSPVGDLADMFRTIWSLGDAGVTVPLTLVRDGARVTVKVPSADRNDFLKSPRLH